MIDIVFLVVKEPEGRLHNMREFQDSDLVTVAFKQPSELRRTRPNHEDDSFK